MDAEQEMLASKASTGRVSCVLDLPDEILKDICRNCNQSDWICLSLVCKRFRDLAASQLYRKFHIVFPDEDDPYFESPIDGLACGLYTFTTSEYNYAKHLREISLDTLSTGPKAETAYKPYQAGLSCGKFMNNLFLLTLRRAPSLDSFRWNIRVELDRAVYKALHDMKTLRHLHLRLHAGPSVYKTPPPLPYPATQHPPKLGASAPSSAPKNLPTFAPFRNIETMSVLDIDDLDMITEVKACIHNSSSTLRKVRLSFSNGLAMKARDPDADPYDSEDDDLQVTPAAQGTANRTQQERKAQEAVLGQLFEVEPFRAKKSTISDELPVEGGQSEDAQGHRSAEGQRFIDELNVVFSRMTSNLTGKDDFKLFEQHESLKSVIKAAEKYVGETDANADSPPTAQVEANSDENSEPNLHLDDDANDVQSSSRELLDRLFTTRDDEYESDLDDVDAEVTGQLFGDELVYIIDRLTHTLNDPALGERVEPQMNSTSRLPATNQNGLVQSHNEDGFKQAISSLTKRTCAALKDTRNTLNLERHSQEFSDGARQARESLELLLQDAKEVQDELKAVEAETTDPYTADAHTRGELCPSEKERQYARDTRGIGLRSLSIHLIPIKASVLGKAIDLHSLRRIALLNVGEQKKFWVLMMKENKLKPLSLQKVFTDDVSLQFLQLVSELDRVTEVFMLRRSSKHRPASLAPTLEITLEQIRKFIFKRHLHTLQRLMIKNQADETWDMDIPTMRLVCSRGQALKELAVSMGMAVMHTFIRNVGSLVNLRALHVTTLRAQDTCLSVMRETRNFIVDAVCSGNGLKLEWLAFGDEERASRLVRRQRVKKLESVTKSKEQTPGSYENNASGSFPVVPVAWDPLTEGEDDEFESLLRHHEVDLIEGFAFYDVYGIRIFKKEVVSGKL
ncbi:hypothetical protein GGR52DRAFT_342374 [Hypoxylon sp. FL1284]|nr:hypothetical protein GGR52DRAFT_342374 [Hypoxylon sp. FL1284]